MGGSVRMSINPCEEWQQVKIPPTLRKCKLGSNERSGLFRRDPLKTIDHQQLKLIGNDCFNIRPLGFSTTAPILTMVGTVDMVINKEQVDESI
jgi:hypothetical protein